MSLFFLILNLLLVACSTDISGSGANSSSNNNSNNNTNSGNNSNGYSSYSNRPTPTTGLLGNGRHVGPASLYPDPNLTPGDAFPGVTAKEVCVSGYSKTVRNVSSAEKAAVYQRYGTQDIPGKDEVDHFVSLELGGSNDVKNLWPEPYAPPPGAHEKDKVEDALHAAVCNGQMSLEEAQLTIRQDWYAYYLKIQGGK